MHASPELDRLFVAAALQLGFVTPVQVEELVVGGAEGPLAQRLQAIGLLTPQDAEAIGVVVNRQLARCNGDSARALQEVAPSTRDLLDGNLTVAPSAGTRLDTPPGAASADDPFVTSAAPPAPPPPEHARRFTILRAHQQGGLGRVSVARDADFNREVALKEILPAAADDQHNRRRFIREAEITGALEHPGVVPVYSLGHYEDGRPYYAMRFIHGKDLQQAIDAYQRLPDADKPLRFRQLLGRFVDVCHTIHYAHSRGVLHRDIKPSNIMLGDYGETLVVDWGLAKASGESGSHEETVEMPVRLSGRALVDMTVAGRVIGTPIYMSPEQAEGRLDQFGVTTDVYCLGATLYHLLTGAPPFEPSSPNVLADVRAGAFEPPRRRAPATPKPLAAICERAMAISPADRYPSAGALALEVERWLADEPVAAYQEPFAARAWRWVRGHRTLVLSGMTAAAVALVALTLGLVLLGSANQKITAAKNLADTNLQEAVAQRQRAEDNAALARRAVKDYYVRVSEESLLDQPGMQRLRNDLLRQALEYYQGFLAESGDDMQLRGEVAAAHFYVGNITEVVDDPAQALPHYERAIEVQRSLVDAPNAADDDAAQYARTLNAMGRAYQKLQRPDEAFDYYERAITLRQQLAEERPDSAERARELASSVMNTGLLFAAHGDPQEALNRLRHAQSIREAHLDPGNEGDPLLQRDLGIGALNIGLLLLQQQRPVDAADYLRDAVSRFETAYRAQPADVGDLSRLATSHRALADVSAALDDPDAAIEEYRAASELMTSLVIRNPEAPAFQVELAGVRMNLGMLLSSLGEPEQALAELQSAIELLDWPPEESPSPRQRRDLGATQREVGRLLIGLGMPAEGLARLKESQATLKALVREHPGQQEFSSELTKTSDALAEAQRETAEPPAEKEA